MSSNSDSKTPWRQRDPVSTNTVLATTIGCALACLSSTFGAAWYIRGAVEDFRREITDLKREQAAAQALSWTVNDMNTFAWQLRYENQKTNLFVPDPRALRAH